MSKASNVSQRSKVSHMGMDCHRNFSRVTARDERGGVVFRQRLEHADRTALREELRRWPAGTPVVLEGTFGWGWLSEELLEAGHEPHLSSSRKVAGWREARGLAKSNKLDADLLSELWGQRPRWWEVWLAPKEVRDRREWLRYRMSLVAVQTQTKNRIHATLHRHGIVHGFADLFGGKGRELLKELAEGDTLREGARRTLGGHLELLEQVRKQIARATRELRGQLGQSQEAKRWRSLPGVSWVLGYTIWAEVGDVSRFRSHRALASYALLAPRAQDSGDEGGDAPLGRHVGHAGRRTLKWAFIEAAHGAVKSGGRFREVFDRRTDGGKRDRNRGYIAVARELCKVGFSCQRDKRDYMDRPPQRPGAAGGQAGEDPGRAQHRRTSRPEAGGPDRPMAAAAP